MKKKTNNETYREFLDVFEQYYTYWDSWSNTQSHPFTHNQVLIIGIYHLTGSLRKASNHLNLPFEEVKQEFSQAFTQLKYGLWKYYLFVERFPEIRPKIQKHCNDTSWSKRSLEQQGLSSNIVQALTAAGIKTPMHIIVEGRKEIKGIPGIGEKEFSELLDLFNYYGCAHLWSE